MGERAAVFIVALLAASAILLVVPKPAPAEVNDMILGGRIYVRNGLFLGDPAAVQEYPFSNNTQFTVWILHSGSWRAYQSRSVPCDVGGLPISVGTCGGWYSILIPAGDKGLYWDFGDTYMVEVFAASWGAPYTNDNFTSHGTGSFYDMIVNGVHDPGEPYEYSGFGNLTNTLHWYGDDNWQQWDIGPRDVDLYPADSTNSLGLDFNGVPVSGPVTVDLSSPNTLGFYVRNGGMGFINVTSTTAAREGALDLVPPWLTPPVPALSNSPWYTVPWTAPSSPGNTTLCVTADVNNDVPETNEVNNQRCVSVSIALPDLVPQPVFVNVSANPDPNSPFSWQISPPCQTVAMSLTDTLTLAAVASNVAPYSTGIQTFSLVMYNTSGCGGGRVGSAFFVSGALGPLPGGAQSPAQTATWPTPASSGTYCLSIEVDPGPPFPFGPVDEGANEGNNTLSLCILVGGPDLIVRPVTVNTVAYTGPVTLAIGFSADMAGQVTNQGEATPTTFGFSLYQGVPLTGPVLGTQSIPGLVASEVSAPPLAYSFTCTVPGTFSFYYYADNGSDVNEVSEANNEFEVRIICQGPDLIPFDVLVNGNPPLPCLPISPGDSVLISARARNTGANSTGVGFDVTFANSSSASGNPSDPPFLNAPFAGLASATTSPEIATISWNSTGLGNSPPFYYINITVDALGVIQEVDEMNNWIVLCISVGGLADVAVDSVTLQGNPVTGPATINLIAGQMLRVGTVVENVGLISTFNSGNASFDLVLCQVSPTPGEIRINVGSLIPLETRAFAFTWRAPLLAPATQQAYDFRVVADHDPGGDSCDLPVGVINEPDDGIANNNVFPVTVNVHELPTAPDVRLSVTGNDGLLTWTPPPGAWGNLNYTVYGGPRPDGIDLATPLGTASGTTFTHTNGLLIRDEFYYVVRSVDERGWEGPTSATVGAYTRAFPVGYSTFSLPLRPFPEAGRTVSSWTSRILTDDFDTIYEYNQTQQRWIGHPKRLDAINPAIDDFRVEFGASYEIYRSTVLPAYRFVGYPASQTSYLDGDNGDPRLGANGTFAGSLAVSLVGGGATLQVSWDVAANRSADEQVGWYHVYRSTSRSAFDFTAAPAANVTPVWDVPAMSWTDPAPTCAAGLCEFYYTVVPVNTAGRRGSSTFSVAVILTRLDVGYNPVGLPLDPDATDTAATVLAGLPAGSVAFNMTANGWKGHVLGMPPTADNFRIERAFGFTLYVQTARTLLWIGR